MCDMAQMFLATFAPPARTAPNQEQTRMADTPNSDFFVSTAWLADNLNAPDLAIVDATFFMPDEGRDAHQEYLAGHIPGAVFFDIDAIADLSSELPHMLPDAPFFEAKMAALGISEEMRIVVYDAPGLLGAARVWWTFRAFDTRNVKILEGGLTAWKAEGRALESGPVERPFAKFIANLDRDAVADAQKVLAASKNGSSQIVDARQAARFRGETVEPRPGVRSGHIPGSVNVPYRELLNDGRLKAPQEIKQVFVQAGVDLARPIITTCGSGVTAAILLLALESIGKKGVVLYDGSWTEWGGRPDLPIATSAA
jgi:thiosulfate/3-mercaptopyruvate sulfurtransferase